MLHPASKILLLFLILLKDLTKDCRRSWENWSTPPQSQFLQRRGESICLIFCLQLPFLVCLQSGDGLRQLLWCLALVGSSHILRAWIYSISCLFFPSDVWVLFYVMFPLLIQAVLQHFAVSADSQFWYIIFSLNGKACLGSSELPGIFLLVVLKHCAEYLFCFPCLWHQNGLYALHSLVPSLAVAGEEPLLWVFSCANALGCCIHELNIWGLPFPAFSCVLHCSTPTLTAWKPHKKHLCLTDRLGPGCKCQPKVSKWVTAHARI